MKKVNKLFLIAVGCFSFFVSGCGKGDDPQSLKAGSKVAAYILQEDARVFNSMQDCIGQLKETAKKYQLILRIDEFITSSHIVYANMGVDPNSLEFLNTCTETGNRYILRIAKK
jgi:hypothetical protein